MNIERMVIVPENAGDIARRRGLLNPPSANGTDPQPDKGDSWEPINLADPQYAIPLDPPEVAGLLYAGYRHVISGLPESAKTLIAYALLLEALRDSKPVAIVDFEMGAHGARRLLTDLGATIDEIRSIYFVAPHESTSDGIQRIVNAERAYVLIDAAIGAYDLSGLDDNSRKDAETFARTWIRPLWQAGIATVLVDHVTKNADTRGKFTIGSERKVGQTDVHLSFEAVKALSRGNTGLVKAIVHKDRGAYLPRPTAAVFELDSNPHDYSISYQRRDPHPTDQEGHFRPTVLMEKVSMFLEQQDEPVAKIAIESAGLGKRAQFVRDALDALVREGFVRSERGAKNAILHSSDRPYRTSEDPNHDSSSRSSEFVPSSSDDQPVCSSRSSPSTEGTRRADEHRPSPSSSEPDDQDQAIIDQLELERLEALARTYTAEQHDNT